MKPFLDEVSWNVDKAECEVTEGACECVAYGFNDVMEINSLMEFGLS